MSPKICSSHLALLYEYLKSNDVAGVEKVEHELTGSEECVACAYVIGSRGEAKEALVGFLTGQGFSLDRNKLKKINPKFNVFNVFLGLVVAVPLSFYSFLFFRNYFDQYVSAIFGSVMFVGVLVVVIRIKFKSLISRKSVDIKL